MAQSTPIRDPKNDSLLTPQNSVFAFIDYQPEQFHGLHSGSKEQMMLNIVALGKIVKAFAVPTVLTTVGVQMGVNAATTPELKAELGDIQEIDRTTLNSWEDPDFHSAIKATGRKKLIIAGLWTEVCVAYPTLDAIKEGYEVYVVADAIGGVTKTSHDSAMERMIQAGAKPITALALACELQRDWSRGHGDTLRKIVQWYFREFRNLESEIPLRNTGHSPETNAHLS